jgi:hypothetical protein
MTGRQLTRVRSLMSLEMRALGVDLLAARELALVYPALRVRRTVLVTPRVMPVINSHVTGSHDRRRAAVHVLRRAADWREAIRRHRDQSGGEKCDLMKTVGALVPIFPPNSQLPTLTPSL